MPRRLQLSDEALEALLAGFRADESLPTLCTAIDEKFSQRISPRQASRLKSEWRAKQAHLDDLIIGTFRTFIRSPSRQAMESLKERLREGFLEYQFSLFTASRKRGRPGETSSQANRTQPKTARATLAQRG